MSFKGSKTTTYSLDWDTIVNLESRLIRDFRATNLFYKAQDLLLISIGSRLGLRVIDNLALKWSDLMNLEIGERFIRTEKKTGKDRILVMSTKLKEVLDIVINNINPNPDHFIFSSQKGKGLKHMCVQNFNQHLKRIMSEYRIKYIGNCSSHLLRKSFIVGSIKKGFQDGDHLSLIKVSRLVGHSNIAHTLKYTNFEQSTAYGLFDLS